MFFAVKREELVTPPSIMLTQTADIRDPHKTTPDCEWKQREEMQCYHPFRSRLAQVEWQTAFWMTKVYSESLPKALVQNGA